MLYLSYWYMNVTWWHRLLHSGSEKDLETSTVHGSTRNSYNGNVEVTFDLDKNLKIKLVNYWDVSIYAVILSSLIFKW